MQKEELMKKLKGFDYRKLTGEDYKKYVDIVQSLDKRTAYKFEQYKAIGVFEEREDFNGNMVKTNKLIGVTLVDTTPINTTSVELRMIEDWATDPKGKKVMLSSSLNSAIYDKGNPRTNSRYYLLAKEQ